MAYLNGRDYSVTAALVGGAICRITRQAAYHGWHLWHNMWYSALQVPWPHSSSNKSHLKEQDLIPNEVRRERNSLVLFHPWPPSTTSCPPRKEPERWRAYFYRKQWQKPLVESVAFHLLRGILRTEPQYSNGVSHYWSHKAKQSKTQQKGQKKKDSEALNPVRWWSEVNKTNTRRWWHLIAAICPLRKQQEPWCQILPLVGYWIMS